MQSKKGSLLEALVNTGSGWLISYLVWLLIIAPVWGFNASPVEILGINLVFTLVSIVRGYVWRRLFNYFGEINDSKNADT
jgi:hypothetical protein